MPVPAWPRACSLAVILALSHAPAAALPPKPAEPGGTRILGGVFVPTGPWRIFANLAGFRAMQPVPMGPGNAVPLVQPRIPPPPGSPRPPR
ncbi:hypothetical protein [Mesoterricola silvestris]|uniref:Uncharacterized protein n=1 Tax=Mesoterricola silvestris TaxID=2927979 RepID=A0AA48GK29_9BACT|nr:hypothetical protein [Mesoterricola silvestris]BDU72639.1 hypothetical protein METEAL_18130 [Mesoterricola silvestris]